MTSDECLPDDFDHLPFDQQFTLMCAYVRAEPTRIFDPRVKLWVSEHKDEINQIAPPSRAAP